MNHCIEAFITNEEGDILGEKRAIDYILFSAKNSVFLWFLYETLDAHECHIGTNGNGSERLYSNDDLHTCRSRLLYFYEEDSKDLQRYIYTYIEENKIEDSVNMITELTEEDSRFEMKYDFSDSNVGLTVGYILKFLDGLIDLDEHIKIKFT